MRPCKLPPDASSPPFAGGEAPPPTDDALAAIGLLTSAPSMPSGSTPTTSSASTPGSALALAGALALARIFSECPNTSVVSAVLARMAAVLYAR
jgi:hypothetical protein